MVSRRYLRHSRTGASLLRRGRGSELRRGIGLFLLLTLLLFAGVDFLLRSSVAEALRYQGKLYAARLLSEEALRVLEPMQLSYDDLSRISRDESGGITSIETNAAGLNQIKSTLERNIAKALDSESEQVRLPIGSLLGSEYLSGRGPRVAVRFTPMGALQTSFESAFQSAGINQTSHRVILNLTLEITTIVPLHRAQTTVTTNLVLAETIIVGRVPEYYTNIVGGGAVPLIPNPLGKQIE